LKLSTRSTKGNRGSPQSVKKQPFLVRIYQKKTRYRGNDQERLVKEVCEAAREVEKSRGATKDQRRKEHFWARGKNSIKSLTNHRGGPDVGKGRGGKRKNKGGGGGSRGKGKKKWVLLLLQEGDRKERKKQKGLTPKKGGWETRPRTKGYNYLAQQVTQRRDRPEPLTKRYSRAAFRQVTRKHDNRKRGPVFHKASQEEYDDRKKSIGRKTREFRGWAKVSCGGLGERE